MPDQVVVDASVLVDLLAVTPLAAAASARLRGTVAHAPAHVDAEVVAALARLERAGQLDATQAGAGVAALVSLPLVRHDLEPLVQGAWDRRSSLRTTDALYVELADRLDAVLLTSDLRLARAWSRAEAIT